jgi:hypothetical protein
MLPRTSQPRDGKAAFRVSEKLAAESTRDEIISQIMLFRSDPVERIQ